MMYNTYYKKNIIIVPKSKQNNINISNKNDKIEKQKLNLWKIVYLKTKTVILKNPF